MEYAEATVGDAAANTAAATDDSVLATEQQQQQHYEATNGDVNTTDAAAAATATTATSDEHAAPTAAAAATMYDSLYQLRRVRRARTQYEKLQRPPNIAPGEPVPSIEGWVVFVRGLPPTSTVEDVQHLFVGFCASDPDYFGVIREVKLPLDKDCLCSGYALVELESHAGYARALRELHNTPVTYAPFTTTTTDGNGDAAATAAATTPIQPLLHVSPAFLAEEDDEDEDDDAAAAAQMTSSSSLLAMAPGEKRVRDGGLATRNDDAAERDARQVRVEEEDDDE